MIVRKPNSVGVVVSRQLPQPPPALLIANRQSHLIGRAAIGAGVVVSRRSTLRSGSSRGGS